MARQRFLSRQKIFDRAVGHLFTQRSAALLPVAAQLIAADAADARSAVSSGRPTTRV
jgi:hypothetical protein